MILTTLITILSGNCKHQFYLKKLLEIVWPDCLIDMYMCLKFEEDNTFSFLNM